MRFTEREMTEALAGAAKSTFVMRPDVRGDAEHVDEKWRALSGFERYQLLNAMGDHVLPVLVALPDVDVAPGTRPTFTDAQVREAVEARTQDDTGRLRRGAVVRLRIELVKAALAAVPPRQDPDALIVPDHL